MPSIGDIEITRIEELFLHEGTGLFEDWSPAFLDLHRQWLAPNFYLPDANKFVLSIHSWLIRTPQFTILIDTCGGNGKDRPASPIFHKLNSPYPDRLKAAGVSFDDIDIVICTHFHVDHVGWNTQLSEGRWRPTFPRARYVLPRIEVEKRDPRRRQDQKLSPANLIFLDSILPVIEAGQSQLVDGEETIVPGIFLIPTHGHSPGQIAVCVRSWGEEALFIGDVMHHPIQVYYPHWNSRFCEDGAMARETRLRVLEHCVHNNSLMLPAHFGAPHCGHVTRRADGFGFLPQHAV
jgi:glyoxylase-like metal-dependent hydrolase (beta-lactamase superfamily II)